jgi:hypothetical protein
LVVLAAKTDEQSTVPRRREAAGRWKRTRSVSHEHKQADLFAPDAVLGLVMPDGYKRSIAAWFDHLSGVPGSC